MFTQIAYTQWRFINFVLIWSDISKNRNNNVIIWINDISCIFETLFRQIHFCFYQIDFKNYVMTWISYNKTLISNITIWIIFTKISFKHAKIILHSSSNCIIHQWIRRSLLILSALISSIEKQQINQQIIRIFKTSMTHFTIIASQIDNIVVNSSKIVTTIDFLLILVLVHLKYALYVINLHVDQRIISKKNARNRKNVLSIVIRHTKHVQNWNVVLNNLLSITKIMK